MYKKRVRTRRGVFNEGRPFETPSWKHYIRVSNITGYSRRHFVISGVGQKKKYIYNVGRWTFSKLKILLLGNTHTIRAGQSTTVRPISPNQYSSHFFFSKSTCSDCIDMYVYEYCMIQIGAYCLTSLFRIGSTWDCIATNMGLYIQCVLKNTANLHIINKHIHGYSNNILLYKIDEYQYDWFI